MKNKLSKLTALLVVLIILAVLIFDLFNRTGIGFKPLWSVRSIDTMKYSRDEALNYLNDGNYQNEINTQVKQIASTGANYIAIDTPYDEQFFPVLQTWVEAARMNGLKVWFRGNWSGWEGWFNYPKIDEKTHIEKTKAFIIKHKDIFENGDIFTACPECENGGPGDPRDTGKVANFRQFMIDEYQATKQEFYIIGKEVISNYNSMNGDVASLVMDAQTTRAMNGVVTIDHYTKDPLELSKKAMEISKQSGAKVVIGEFGAPIPDINGVMTQDQQSDWINNALSELSKNPNVVGVNYWANQKSTTALWNNNLTERKAVTVLDSFYKATVISISPN